MQGSESLRFSKKKNAPYKMIAALFDIPGAGDIMNPKGVWLWKK